MKHPFSYKVSFLLSIIFHVILLIFLFIGFLSISPKPKTIASPSNKVVVATTIQQKEVDKEIQRIKASEQRKEAVLRKKQKHLERLAKQARQRRIREQKRLKKLKQQQERQKQQAAKRLAELKKQQAVALKNIKKLKQEKAKVLKKKKKPKKKESKQFFEQEFQRQLTLEGNELNAAKAKRIQTILNKYKILITNAISEQWLVPQNIQKEAHCRISIKVAPGGTVLAVKLLEQSCNQVLYRSARTAVYKASPLPVPKNPELFNSFREINLTVKPHVT